MATATDRVIEDALELPTDARIELVDRILVSLNLPTQPDILSRPSYGIRRECC